MDIKTLATILIIFHLASAGFIGNVLHKQWGLFKTCIPRKLRNFRRLLFALSLVIFAGNLVPILVDGITIFGGVVGRTQHPKPISVAYALSNAATQMICAGLIWLLYKMAENVLKSDDDS